jgi:aspartate/methionine/tyrosine aminotransferase
MDFPVSPLIAGVHFPPISEVRQWIEERPQGLAVTDLCQAVPDYPPAPGLVEQLQRITLDPLTARYSPDEGLPQVREAVSARYRRVYGGGPTAGQICLTVGASQAFWSALVTLCRTGDEVILQTPAYFDHPMALEMLGIRAVFAPFEEEDGGILTPEKVERLITTRTRAILAVTPSNPTGAVTPPETISSLFQLARRHGIALVLDETYADFIPGGGPPHHLFQDSGWERHLVQVMSFGKTYALTGYRAGCLVASEQFLHHALKAQDTMTVCQPRVTQLALAWAAEHLDDWVAANREMMTRRHRAFRDAFTAPGNPFTLVSSGSFFAWVRHPWPGLTGREAARRLARERGVMTLPGEVFGPGLEPYLRLAIGNVQQQEIPEAVARLRTVTA